MECSRIAGGPAGEGVDAARWDPMIQRAFYNGWKSIHGLKHQTLDTAFGMTAHMYGPTSLRRNDLKLLRESQLNQKFEQIQREKPLTYILRGQYIPEAITPS